MALLLSGCTPSPESVCKHFDDVDPKTSGKSAQEKRTTHDKCLADLTTMKAKYPGTYGCVTACTKFETEDATMLCSLDCMSKDPQMKADTEKETKREREKSDETEKKKADWSTRPLKATDAHTGGLVFSIEVPDGLKKDETESYVMFSDDGTGFSGASVTLRVSPFPVSDLSYAEGVEKANSKVVSKKQKTADGYVLVSHGAEKESLSVRVARKLGANKSLECSVTEAGIKGGIPNFAGQSAAFEKICSSVKPKA